MIREDYGEEAPSPLSLAGMPFGWRAPVVVRWRVGRGRCEVEGGEGEKLDTGVTAIVHLDSPDHNTMFRSSFESGCL